MTGTDAELSGISESTSHSMGSCISPSIILDDDHGLADGELEALAAHGSPGECPGAGRPAPGDDELVTRAGIEFTRRADVVLELFLEAVADLPAGDEGAVDAREGRVVDAEDNGEAWARPLFTGGRALGFSGRRWCRRCPRLQTDQGADVAGGNAIGLDAPQAREAEELRHLALDDLAVGLHHGDLLARVDLAVEDAPDADAPDVVVVVDRRDEHLPARRSTSASGVGTCLTMASKIGRRSAFG